MTLNDTGTRFTTDSRGELALRPTWQNTLDYNAPGAEWWGHIDTFREAAKGVGYPYIYWNDRVYDTATGEAVMVSTHHPMLGTHLDGGGHRCH